MSCAGGQTRAGEELNRRLNQGNEIVAITLHGLALLHALEWFAPLQVSARLGQGAAALIRSLHVPLGSAAPQSGLRVLQVSQEKFSEMADGNQTPALFERLMGDHPSKLTAGLVPTFRARFGEGERAGTLPGGGRNNKGCKEFNKACEGRIEGMGGVTRPEQNPWLSLQEPSCNRGGFCWVQIPVPPIPPPFCLGQPRVGQMAWQGVDLHYRKWWPVFLQEEGYFCPPGRWKADL